MLTLSYNPATFFGTGTVFEFTTPLTLPSVVYQSPNAVEVTLGNFQGAAKNSLRTLALVARNMNIDLTGHIRAVQTLLDTQLATDKVFANAFKSDVVVQYGLNVADQGQSVVLYMAVQVGAVTRQFFYSTVNANAGVLPGARIYGNASDAAVA